MQRVFSETVNRLTNRVMQLENAISKSDSGAAQGSKKYALPQLSGCGSGRGSGRGSATGSSSSSGYGSIVRKGLNVELSAPSLAVDRVSGGANRIVNTKNARGNIGQKNFYSD